MERIKMAIQKSGRLTEKTLGLLKNCGVEFSWSKDKLYSVGLNFPLDLLLVRDDDIPEYVLDGVCDLGIVGENVLTEKTLKRKKNLKPLKNLGFGKCRLSMAIPNALKYPGPELFQNSKIATSYPYTMQNWLEQNNVTAEVIELAGSVEIGPQIGVCDYICDLVSTGNTLRSNGLKEVQTILESQSVIIETPSEFLTPEKKTLINRLMSRIAGVQTAKSSKYIMLNCSLNNLEKIKTILPGVERPSVVPLEGDLNRVAVHSVCQENVFWETIENLKEAGASGILVLPIEKMM